MSKKICAKMPPPTSQWILKTLQSTRKNLVTSSPHKSILAQGNSSKRFLDSKKQFQKNNPALRNPAPPTNRKRKRTKKQPRGEAQTPKKPPLPPEIPTPPDKRPQLESPRKKRRKRTRTESLEPDRRDPSENQSLLWYSLRPRVD